MPSLQRRAAQSITEYMKIVDELPPTTLAGLWFRGQSKSQNRLLPGALRDTTLMTDGRLFPIQQNQIVRSGGSLVTGINPERMLAEFKRQARPFVDGAPLNEFEWMFLAQHHGLPTRLLDWSTNALAALYFAVSGASVTTGDGSKACEEYLDADSDELRDDGFAVFVIDPGAINANSLGVSDPVDISAVPDKWAHYLDPASDDRAYVPICVTAPHISPRIRAQSGVFTLHGANIWPLDYYDVLRPLITKIFIPYTASLEIAKSLAKVGINRSFIYPGLDAIAYDVSTAERLRHVAEKAAYFQSSQANSIRPLKGKKQKK